jgi:hypothetical protein
MNNKQIIIKFWLVAALLLVLYIVSFFLSGNSREFFLKEGGVVETATFLGYLLCSVLIFYKGRFNYLKRYYYLVFFIVFFMFRELDFHTRFTTMGLFKSKIFVSGNVSIIEKIIAAAFILLFIYFTYLIVRKDLKSFFRSFKNHSAISYGILIVAVLLGVTKFFLDGIGRKLGMAGIQLGKNMPVYFAALEEILELGIPIILLIIFTAYFYDNKT